MKVLIYAMTSIGWRSYEVDFQEGVSIWHYLRKVPGLIGKRKTSKLLVRKLTEKGPVWVRARTSVVLKKDEHIALAPKG